MTTSTRLSIRSPGVWPRSTAKRLPRRRPRSIGSGRRQRPSFSRATMCSSQCWPCQAHRRACQDCDIGYSIASDFDMNFGGIYTFGRADERTRYAEEIDMKLWKAVLLILFALAVAARDTADSPEDSPTGDSQSTAWSTGLPRFHLPSLGAIRLAARLLNWRAKKAGRMLPSGSARLSRTSWKSWESTRKPDTWSTSRSIPTGGTASIWPKQCIRRLFSLMG